MDEGRGLIGYFTRHRTVANLLLALMVVAGLWAATSMRAQYFPDVVVSEVTVSVAWDGAGAEDVDRGVVQVLEPALLGLDGVADVSSRAREGTARITVEFDPGTDLDRAADEVQTAVDAVTGLPEGAEEPEVRRGAWRDQVTDVVITGPVGVDQLARFADEFTARLFAEGITRTTIQGLAAPETRVEVATVDLMRHDLTMEDIAAAIAASARTAPAGDVGDGAARVRTGTEARGEAQIGAIVLRTRADGTNLTVADVATVTVRGADAGRAAYVGANPAMTIRVDRNATGDAIAMQAAVSATAEAMGPTLPAGVTIDLVRTRADQISDRLALLIDNGLMGLGLVVVLLFLFLNARIALWVAMGIPVALFGALAAMHVMGLTLNMISLFALIIMLGIVVDDAIVVAEHADFRARRLGEDPLTAAENGARRMAAPVLASSITTVVAFLGLIAIGGRFGDLIADIPITVTLVLVASLVECFLILPNHVVGALVQGGRVAWYDRPSEAVNRGMFWVQERAMKPLMRGVIAWRYPVLAACVAALAWAGGLFVSGEVRFRLFAPPENSSITGNFAMLTGANRADSLAMMAELQRAVDAVAERFEAEAGVNPVTFVLAEVGGGAGRGLASAETKDADLLGGISVELIDPDLRPFTTGAFLAALQEEVRPHPRMEELSFRGGFFGPGGSALSVDLFGAGPAQLKAAAEALKAAVARFPEVSGVEDSLAYDKDELILTLTPQGRALGFDLATLGRALRDRLNGIEAATWPDGPRTASVRVTLPEGELTADFLDRMLLRAGPGVHVPLADIVAVERRSGFSSIQRENGLQVVSVTGDVAQDDPARFAAIRAEIAGVIVPAIEQEFGVGSRQSGLAEQERDFAGDAQIALILCLLGIYLTLAWIFASWTRPMVVMTVIPFGLVGAIAGHWHWGMPISLFSVVGMIGMAGIIINDAIVLVSTIDEYAERRGLRPAIVDGVADRLRPVLLTTLTTVLGLAPLLFERSSQAEFLKPTVVTLVYGLGLGMVLVLLVVPAVIAIQDDLGRPLRALWRAGRARRSPRLRAGVRIGVAGVAAAFAATVLPVALTGALPGWLAPLAGGAGPVAGAMAAFAGLSLAVVLAVGVWSVRGEGRRAGRARA
jgi:multidrug efflux pump subunit AcrB